MKKTIFRLFLLMVFVISACTPFNAVPTPVPGIVSTIVAATQNAAALQTVAAMPPVTQTPTPTWTPRGPTITPFSTATTFVFVYTPTNTPTSTPTITPTRVPVTEWPDWKTGTVISMPQGSGENIGTNKMFNGWKGVEVVVTRKNGVKLRSAPNKAIGGPMAERGAILTLTGIMNKNNDFGWLFVKVTAPDGKQYWVGGSEGEETEPKECLAFYNP